MNAVRFEECLGRSVIAFGLDALHFREQPADAVAQLSDASRPGAPLLPPVSDLRPVSAAVAIAVAALGACWRPAPTASNSKDRNTM